MSYKSFVSPSTLKQTDKVKLMRWATEHHMPSEPGVAFERWLDALQGVDEETKAKALALSRGWTSGPAAALPHDLVAAEARLGLLGLFALAAAAILAAAGRVVDVAGEAVQQVDAAAELVRAEILREVLDEAERDNSSDEGGAAADEDGAGATNEDGAGATISKYDLLVNTGKLLSEFNVTQLTSAEISELDNNTSSQIKTLIKNVSTAFSTMFIGVATFNMANSFNHLSPIIEQFFSETISQVALKHNIGFLQDLQMDLNTSKQLTIPNSYQRVVTALKPDITVCLEKFGVRENDAENIADIIFKNVETKFHEAKSLNRWLVKDVTSDNMREQLITLSRQHIMTKMRSNTVATDLYEMIILDTVLGSQDLFVENKKQDILNNVSISPDNAMGKAIIEMYKTRVKQYASNAQNVTDRVRWELFGRSSDSIAGPKLISDVLDIARILSPTILAKYQNDTLALTQDLVDRLEIYIKHKDKDKDITVPIEWVTGIVGAALLSYVLPSMVNALSKCRNVPCRTSDRSGGESKTDGSAHTTGQYPEFPDINGDLYVRRHGNGFRWAQLLTRHNEEQLRRASRHGRRLMWTKPADDNAGWVNKFEGWFKVGSDDNGWYYTDGAGNRQEIAENLIPKA